MTLVLRGGKDTDDAASSGGQPGIPEESVEPTKSSTDMPTKFRTVTPSVAPTVFLQYDPPSEEDCREISNGNNPGGNTILRNFSVELEITINKPADDIVPYMMFLQEKMQEILAPALVGCDDGNGNKTAVSSSSL